jgi:hypothetical protein
MNRRNANTEDKEVETPSARPVRIPVGQRPKLAVVGKDPRYVYRWVNDYTGRINDFKLGGWELCTNDEVDVGNFRAEEASAVGSLASTVVDATMGTRAYVMKILKEWFDEDQQRWEAENAANEETLGPNTRDGEYGSISIDRSGRR